MIAYHADCNLILQYTFKSRSNTNCIAEYNAIMTRLAARSLSVDLQILDNKASAAYKQAVTFTWQATFQLVPQDMHCRTCAERAIQTFKNHFLSILARVDPSFPPYLWDHLLPQAELTLNLLQQAALNPWISAWELFHGPFDINKTPLRPVGRCVLIHAKPANWRSWDYCAKEGFYIGPALDTYCCFKLVKSNTKSQVISNTVEFCHAYCTNPSPSAKDKIFMACKSRPVPSRMRPRQSASPRLMLLPICEIFLNLDASLVLLLCHPPTSRPQAVQGWTCWNFQGWPSL